MTGIASRRRFAREHGQRLTPPARILPSRGARMRTVEDQPPPPMETLPTPLRRHPPPTPTGSTPGVRPTAVNWSLGTSGQPKAGFFPQPAQPQVPGLNSSPMRTPPGSTCGDAPPAKPPLRDATRGKTARRCCYHRQAEEGDDRGLPRGVRRALSTRRLCRQTPPCQSSVWVLAVVSVHVPISAVIAA
ncbi:hypothetical protein ABB37_06958 [Leptomonas pyrrhocoris]|uniref:Uncharacterized protein n=1 Tax=Leptomonas pyrrhocoris TaxID=157538 RepID=A0A0M9FWL9_LEPPY|nr:hypothetical protein ABB37_06958 [Leptomonas pyrrhocoris]KPA77590.1 hypothetical protein ABB37_06958 [Leptomonas pyrrhocoris]|eukprot:XP_015656029.1 hypothetical protein ABB37_06958 [Leptomonas pyrrhocoris]